MDLTQPEIASSSLDVLIVDDSPTDRGLISAYLRLGSSQGFTVEYAGTLAEACEHLRHTWAHCVLLDLALPDTSNLKGLEAFRRLFPELPVIVLTGHDDDAIGDAALRQGAQDYIAKNDLTPSILRRAVRHAVERQRQQRELDLVRNELAQEVATRHLAEQSAAQAHQRARALVEQTSDIIAILGVDGCFTFVNPAVRTVLGYEPEALVGSQAFDLVHPDDAVDAIAYFVESLETAGAHPPRQRRLRHRDGSWVPVESVATNALEDPAIQGLVLTIRDVSNR